jgi:hypothetical protein
MKMKRQTYSDGPEDAWAELKVRFWRLATTFDSDAFSLYSHISKHRRNRSCTRSKASYRSSCISSVHSEEVALNFKFPDDVDDGSRALDQVDAILQNSMFSGLRKVEICLPRVLTSVGVQVGSRDRKLNASMSCPWHYLCWRYACQ